VFARQIDRVVGKPERNFRQREVGELDFLAEDEVAIAVVAAEGGCAIVANLQRPHLKLFGGDTRIVRLDDRNLVQQPIGPALVGYLFRAVGEQHFAVDAVAIPMLAAGELREIGGGESFVVDHVGLLSSLVLGCSAAAPLAFAENGGVQAASGFAGTRNAT
jgi:hypothetical protein